MVYSSIINRGGHQKLIEGAATSANVDVKARFHPPLDRSTVAPRPESVWSSRRNGMGNNDCIHDRFLIREALGGSQAAFAQLIRDNDYAVLKLALRITGSSNDAQEICQEGFLKAYRNLGCFRFDGSFPTWIYRIVANLCLDHLRRNRTRKERRGVVVNAEGEEYDLVFQTPDNRPTDLPTIQIRSSCVGNCGHTSCTPCKD
jgi:RNA polymerase sigma-70 factor, ECF subfamily